MTRLRRPSPGHRPQDTASAFLSSPPNDRLRASSVALLLLGLLQAAWRGTADPALGLAGFLAASAGAAGAGSADAHSSSSPVARIAADVVGLVALAAPLSVSSDVLRWIFRLGARGGNVSFLSAVVGAAALIAKLAVFWSARDVKRAGGGTDPLGGAFPGMGGGAGGTTTLLRWGRPERGRRVQTGAGRRTASSDRRTPRGS